jgi:hypothetical protein
MEIIKKDTQVSEILKIYPELTDFLMLEYPDDTKKYTQLGGMILKYCRIADWGRIRLSH